MVVALCGVARADEVRRMPAELAPPAIGPLLRLRLLEGVEPPGPAAALVRRGGAVEVLRGDLAQVLEATARASRVELAWPLELHRDLGGEAIGLPMDLAARQEALGLLGAGVLVGVVDTGIDWTHPDFMGRDGRHRVAWLLDLSLGERVGAHPGVEVYGGALWSAAELTEALAGERVVPSRDRVGHGTHVAGVIGGLGEGFAAGVAPEVDFIVVKANQGEQFAFTEADVLDGVSFILERAEDAGRPVVINLSLGGHMGPHDGGSDLERRLGELLSARPGRALVASAGNSGAEDVHASGFLTGEVERLPIVVPSYERGDGAASEAYVDLWYTAGEPVRASLIAPDGRRLERIEEGDAAMLGGRGESLLAVSHEAETDTYPGLRQILVVLREPDVGALEAGGYVLELEGGRGRFDAWIALRGAFGARFGGFIDPNTRITVPGTSPAAISVGAWVSRSSWPSRSGGVPTLEVTLGAPAVFSGTGPTRDQRPKPDVLAPGLFVLSALSAAADPRVNPGSFYGAASRAGVDPVLEGGLYASSQGTSAASPFVAGLAALLLEQDPTRDVEAIRDIVRASSQRVEVGASRFWHPKAGFGLIDVEAALALGRGERGAGAPSATRSDVGLSLDVLHPEADQGVRVFVVPRGEGGAPLPPGWSVAVEAEFEQGEAVVEAAERLGEHVAAVRVRPGTARGVGRVRVSVDGVALESSPQLNIIASPEELGGEGPPSEVSSRDHACAAVWGEPRGGGGWVWLVLLGVLKWRR
ncbi:MAG: hypothetical protein CMH57_07065 [Myxococcales bacterium]|nr:hypothetical protein [Myxococcales bacterium]